MAGVEGNGQTELAEAVIGVRRPAAGRIEMQGEEITRMPVGKRFERGLAHIPQDRVKEGLILDFPLTDNLVLSIRNGPPVSKHGVIDWRAAQTVSRKLIADYQIKASSPEEACKNLSGGNMQKVVVARELSKKPRVIIACQPTRGVDIGASEYIRRMLMEMRRRGQRRAAHLRRPRRGHGAQRPDHGHVRRQEDRASCCAPRRTSTSSGG